jgi:hypothetical protein
MLLCHLCNQKCRTKSFSAHGSIGPDQKQQSTCLERCTRRLNVREMISSQSRAPCLCWHQPIRANRTFHKSACGKRPVNSIIRWNRRATFFRRSAFSVHSMPCSVLLLTQLSWDCLENVRCVLERPQTGCWERALVIITWEADKLSSSA